MKPHLDYSHEGTLPEHGRTDMTFDQNALAHLMSILTDLYSDAELAVIREYSTNAWDAHVAAGNPAPIEVTLPVELSPFFIVTDHGTGMSLHTIREEFSRYGFSSKRGNDNEVGMLGLGCKSGLAYTSQFTLVSIKDGERVTVLVTRNPNGAGALQVIDVSPTTEPNGTTVTIPVVNPTSFRGKAGHFFYFWEPGTVLVDEVEPPCIWTDKGTISLDPDVALIQDNYSYLVMGQVPYRVDNNKLFPHNNYLHSDQVRVVARVPIGTIDFTPSREDLNFTKRTVETLDTLRQFTLDRLILEAQRSLDRCSSHHEAYMLYMKWHDQMRRTLNQRQQHRFHFQGDPIPLEYEYIAEHATAMRIAEPREYERDSSTCLTWLSVSTILRYQLIVYGYNQLSRVSPSTRYRVREYCKANGITKGSVLFMHDNSSSPWIAHIPHVSFEELQQIPLPKREPVKRAPRTKFRVLTENSKVNGADMDELPDNCACWIPGFAANLSRPKIFAFAEALGVQVAVVYSTETKRFNKKYPTLPEFKDWWHGAYQQFVAGLSPWDLFWVNGGKRDNWSRNSLIHGSLLPGLEELVPVDRTEISKIVDPDLADFLRQAYDNAPHSIRWKATSLAGLFDHFRYHVEGDHVPCNILIPEGAEIRSWQQRIKKQYPVLDFYLGNHKALVDILNAQYIVRSGLGIIPATL